MSGRQGILDRDGFEIIECNYDDFEIINNKIVARNIKVDVYGI